MRSESELPYPKSTIKRAIATLILIEENIDLLVVAFTELQNFYPDEIYSYCKSMFGHPKDINSYDTKTTDKITKAFTDEKINKIMEDFQKSQTQIDKELEFLFDLAEKGQYWKNLKKNVQENVENYKKNPSEYFSDNSIEYYNRGVEKNKLQDYEGEIEEYNKALEINPNFTEAYINRGFAKNILKDHKGAIVDYNKAIEINPNFGIAYYNRGATKSNLGDFYGEIEDYNKALEINPDFAEVYYNRGIARLNLGQKYEARVDLNKAGELGIVEAYEIIRKYF